MTIREDAREGGVAEKTRGGSSAPPGDRSPRRLLPLLGRVLFTGTALGLLVAFLPRAELWAALRTVPVTLWALAVAGFLCAHAASAFKWRLLVRACGVPLGLGEALRAHAAGLFANLFLPSLVGGDFLRAGIVIRRGGRVEAMTVSGVADRLLDTIALAGLAAAGASMAPGVIDGVAERTLGVTVAIVVSLLALVFVVRGSALRERLPDRLRLPFDEASVALGSLTERPAVAITALLMSAAIQATLVLLNVRLGVAMGIELPLAVWFLVWPLARLVALAPVSLGGIGLREIAIAGLMTPFGVPPSRSVAQSLVWETVLVSGGLLGGLAALRASKPRGGRS